MKKIIVLACAAIMLIASYSSVFSYGYGEAGEDPLITMFKKIVIEAKKGEKNWDNISAIVKECEQPVSNLGKYFDLKLYKRFDAGLSEKDLGKLINNTANLIFLSMIEKLDLILKDNFKDYEFAKGRLALCEQYYRELFQGNVMKMDKKNGTSLNDEILNNFREIHTTIGKPDRFGVGSIPPQPDKYKERYIAIKSALLKAFPYFDNV